jgi:membrane fusion protein (multidrug efflux system)
VEEVRRSRRDRVKEAQRQEILDTALSLFAGKGYHNVTMHEIAEEAEFAIGTLYRFFRNKEDLYRALMLQKSEEFNEALLKAIEGPDDVMEKLRGYITTKTGLFKAHLQVIRLYFSETYGESFDQMAGLDSEILRRRDIILKAVERVFEKGMRGKRFRKVADPRSLTVALEGITTAFFFQWLEDPERYPDPGDPDVILGILCKGLVNSHDARIAGNPESMSRRKRRRCLMRFRKNNVLASAISIVLILACGTVLGACGRQKPQQAPPPPEVGTVTVKEQEVVLTTELPGRTSAYLVAEVRPQVSGIIQERLFDEGSSVKKGEVLYRIDPAPFQAAYDSAEASLKRAEANVPAIRSRAERYRELLADKAVSRQDFDDVESAFRQAEAEVSYWKAAVKTARINLGYTKVTAPIPGRIGKSNMTEGALVTANQPTPLAVIQQLDPIYVDVPQSTAELLRLKRRVASGVLARDDSDYNKVRLNLEDGTAYPLEALSSSRMWTVERTPGALSCGRVSQPDGILLPGMFVRGVAQEVSTGRPSSYLSTPFRATRGNPLALLVGPDGKVEQRQLSIDRPGATSGCDLRLAPGEKVMLRACRR